MYVKPNINKNIIQTFQRDILETVSDQVYSSEENVHFKK